MTETLEEFELQLSKQRSKCELAGISVLPWESGIENLSVSTRSERFLPQARENVMQKQRLKRPPRNVPSGC